MGTEEAPQGSPIEVEVKFAVGPGTEAALAALGAVGLPHIPPFRDCYFDGPRAPLGRADVWLRHRQGQGWQLKLPYSNPQAPHRDPQVSHHDLQPPNGSTEPHGDAEATQKSFEFAKKSSQLPYSNPQVIHGDPQVSHCNPQLPHSDTKAHGDAEGTQRPIEMAESNHQLPHSNPQVPHGDPQPPHSPPKLPHNSLELPHSPPQLTHSDTQLPHSDPEPPHEPPKLPHSPPEPLPPSSSTVYREVWGDAGVLAELGRVLGVPMGPWGRVEEALGPLGLRPIASFVTLRRSARLAGGVRVELDEADFGYGVGEVEVVLGGKGEEGGESTPQEVVAAKERVEELCRALGAEPRHHVPGKLSVFLARYRPCYYRLLRRAGRLEGVEGLEGVGEIQ